MKKLLCSILILSVLLGLTACGKKAPINEYLQNSTKTPLVFYYGNVDDKNDAPEEFWLFLNGKVKILPNVLAYTMDDITKMDDETLISSTETALEVELQSYITGYTEMVAKLSSSYPSSNLYRFYRLIDLYKKSDGLYHLNGENSQFVLNDQVKEIESSINTVIKEKGVDSYSKALLFHPTQYHMPDYVDYVYVAETDASGNNIERFYMVVDNERYFTGNLEIVVQDYNHRTPITILGSEVFSYSQHSARVNNYCYDHWHSDDASYNELAGVMASSITFGHDPNAADDTCYNLHYKPLQYEETMTFLDTKFYVSDCFLTKDAAFKSVSPDSRISMTQQSNYGPVDYSQDGILYLIDPTPMDITQYFADHK